MKCIDLTDDVIKDLGILSSYSKKLEQVKIFLNHIVKIQNISKSRKLRNLTIEGRIVVFKSLALALLTKIQMAFIWKGKNPKIKNSTLCNGYEYDGLKNVDIFSKVVS